MALTPNSISPVESVNSNNQTTLSRCKKLVRFSRFEKVFLTHSADEYDRRSIFSPPLPAQHTQLYQTPCF
ncbi:hypothetical protein K493DRAFT_316496 [Basidiobolus meristosporus CBS 931.73]|uniref:Uncharacterized protein n=1 Tax=Basidiobolus meristosporus CBS 931.73 TaxID=1314790 RepID=A0A1Y1Y3Q8_9FUNG|nr:hypothetical protein K493DRAFT_316496 [Basidiobolus meristosporus CBS 931.73]|eukprot:ORX92609.1 hypothetical protein K493DRAFT_316496 [Basidiobolus meristosporus CBS 931.73]